MLTVTPVLLTLRRFRGHFDGKWRFMGQGEYAGSACICLLHHVSNHCRIRGPDTVARSPRGAS